MQWLGNWEMVKIYSYFYIIISAMIEPDLYYKHNTTITSQQIFDNFKKLKSILEEKNYPDIFIAGPDVATLSRENILSE